MTINTNQQSNKENKNSASHISSINKANEDTVNHSPLQNTENQHIPFILFDSHSNHKNISKNKN